MLYLEAPVVLLILFIQSSIKRNFSKMTLNTVLFCRTSVLVVLSMFGWPQVVESCCCCLPPFCGTTDTLCYCELFGCNCDTSTPYCWHSHDWWCLNTFPSNELCAARRKRRSINEVPNPSKIYLTRSNHLLV